MHLQLPLTGKLPLCDAHPIAAGPELILTELSELAAVGDVSEKVQRLINNSLPPEERPSDGRFFMLRYRKGGSRFPA